MQCNWVLHLARSVLAGISAAAICIAAHVQSAAESGEGPTFWRKDGVCIAAQQQHDDSSYCDKGYAARGGSLSCCEQPGD